MAEEVHYDIAELLGGSVAAITAVFGDLSDNQLAALVDAERGAEKPRQTLLAAVETEQAARAAQASEAKLAREAERLAQEGAAAAEKVKKAVSASVQFSARENELMAENEQLRGENVRLTALLTEQQATIDGFSRDGQSGDATESAAKRHLMVLGNKIEQPCIVLFVGYGDQVIEEIPALAFQPQDFRAENGGYTLLKPIEFPVHGAARDLYAVWIADRSGSTDDDGRLIGFACEMLKPLHVGGGRSAHIPAGHLFFTGEAA